MNISEYRWKAARFSGFIVDNTATINSRFVTVAGACLEAIYQDYTSQISPDDATEDVAPGGDRYSLYRGFCSAAGGAWLWLEDLLMNGEDRALGITAWCAGRLVHSHGGAMANGAHDTAARYSFEGAIRKSALLLPSWKPLRAENYAHLAAATPGGNVPAPLGRILYKLRESTYLGKEVFVRGDYGLEETRPDFNNFKTAEANWNENVINVHHLTGAAMEWVVGEIYKMDVTRAWLISSPSAKESSEGVRMVLLENSAFLSELVCLSPLMGSVGNLREIASECVTAHCTASFYHLLRDAMVDPRDYIDAAISARATGCLILIIIWMTCNPSTVVRMDRRLAGHPDIPEDLRRMYADLLPGSSPAIIRWLTQGAMTVLLPPSLRTHLKRVLDIDENRVSVIRHGSLIPPPNTTILAGNLRRLVTAVWHATNGTRKALSGLRYLTEKYPEAIDLLSLFPWVDPSQWQGDVPYLFGYYATSPSVGHSTFPLRAVCTLQPRIADVDLITTLLLDYTLGPYLKWRGYETDPALIAGRAAVVDRWTDDERRYAEFVEGGMGPMWREIFRIRRFGAHERDRLRAEVERIVTYWLNKG
jgi:hypothetical protein